MAECRYCFVELIEKGRGRIPDFCCNAHRQAHYRLSTVGIHSTAEKNRIRSRLKPLRNDTGAGSNLVKPLRNDTGAGSNLVKPLRNDTGAGSNLVKPLRKSGTCSS